MTKHGNRITDNALTADSGENLITKALHDIEERTNWHVSDKEKFAGAHGVYYDSKKVGSFFVEVGNRARVKGVLKLQLRPLPYDEGYIIRFVGDQIKTSSIRLPKIYLDKPWNEEDGYGFLIFEDLSGFSNLWKNVPTTFQDRENHKKFLKEFLGVLPIKAFVEKPTESYNEQLKESFDHFYAIAQHSNHRHISDKEILSFKEKYFKIIEKLEFDDPHFTHSHLTGLDVKVDVHNNQYILLANLYWKWRPPYWEIVFPIWNDLVRPRGMNLTFDKFLETLNSWNSLWQGDLYDHNPTTQSSYWAMMLSFAMNTIMLDLGASEWKDNEIEEKTILLNCWRQFFEWIVESKLLKR